MFCVLFGIVSIPVCLVMLAAIGRKIKKAVHVLDAKLVHKLQPCKERWVGRSFQTIVICIVGVLLFMIIPSVVFMVVEGWAYRDAMYYTFVTLTTIGFGDYVAGGYSITDSVTHSPCFTAAYPSFTQYCHIQ